MTDTEAKILTIHRLLKEDFTEEQVRIILVAALEQITNNNHDKIVRVLDEYYKMFKKNEF